MSAQAGKAIRREIRHWKLHLRSDKSRFDLAFMFRAKIQGWINYYGRFYKSEMYRTLCQINRKLCLWAMRKFKKLKHHRSRAEHRLGEIAKKHPNLFPHWKPIAGSMGDRREIEARLDVLVNTSAPLEAEMELTGPVKAVLHAASSATDTDFTVVLADVFPDGRVNLIQDGILRTGFRDPDKAPQPIEPGRIYACDIDLWATSYLIGKGHCLRVEISSSDFNRYDRNPNTGIVFGNSPGTVTATQTVHHNTQYPSHIVLPVIPHK